MSEQRLWTARFCAALSINLFMACVFYLLLTSMAGYALQGFAASDSLAGLASTGFVIGAMLSRLATGKYLDLVGKRRFILLAMVAFVVIALAYIPVSNLWLLIILRVVHGVAFGAGNTALVAAVQQVIPPGRRAEGNGYFATVTTVATGLGPFLAGWLIQHHGYPPVFLMAAVCGAGGFISACFFRAPERELSSRDRHRLKSWHIDTYVDRATVSRGLINTIAGLAYSTVLSFLVVYTAGAGVPQAASAYFVTFALASLATRLIAGRIQDRLGDNVVILPLYLLFICGMLLITLSSGLVGIMTAGLLIGAGYGSLMPCLLAVAVRESDPAQVGVVASTYYVLYDLGVGVGPVILGMVITYLDFQTMFAVATILALGSGLLYVAVHGRSASARHTPPTSA